MEKNRRQFLRQLAGFGGVATMSTVPIVAKAAAAATTKVQDIRLSSHKGYVRLVFDLNKSVDHSIFTLNKPERIVLDLKNTKMTHGMVDRVGANSLIRSIRSGVRDGNDLRVVFDLQHEVKPRSFLLGPSGKSGYRLVLDLHNEKAGSSISKKTAPKKKALRDVIIAIDAGHGGKDPGALGKKGTREKTVTLQMAKRLEKKINQQKGMKAVLTRKNDRYMRLRDRIHKARDYNADMMISLHADSFPDPRARGSSIYALSVDGATSETAKLLAEKENAADLLFGDVSLAIEDEMVKEVLFDLSLTGTIQSSLDIGDEILRQIKYVNRVHKKQVQQAGFAVLKAPNIPSVLLETAFISNPREEKNLKSAAHQIKVANAISKGVANYFARKAPPGTWLSASTAEYKVKSGDTLGSIAKRYQTSVENLRARNAMHTSSLNAGQVLKIPVS
jgi:N-acetylmuramoyl-L-alanine amidase